MVLKSGKLLKHSHSIFGSKWKVKWVHLDEVSLKYYPMVVDQKVIQGAKPKVLMLRDYTVSIVDDRKSSRKYSFQLLGRNKEKTRVFACATERECREWVDAITQPVAPKPNQIDEDKVVEEDTDSDAMKKAKAAFAKLDPTSSGKVSTARLHDLLETISFLQTLHIIFCLYMGWHGSSDEFAVVQQALDPQLIGKIPRVHFVAWAHAHFSAPDSPPPRPSSDFVEAAPVTTDWNGLFWELQQSDHATPSSVVSQGLSLAIMLKDFHDAAQAFARTIVDDILLHPTAGSAIDPPTAEHALLGYIDCPLFRSNGLCGFVYHPTTHLAAKTLGHDVRSAQAFQAALDSVGASDAVGVPLQCLVDYMGVRVLVLAELFHAMPKSVQDKTAACAAIQGTMHYLHMCEPHPDTVSKILPLDTHVVQAAHGRVVLTKLRHLCASDVLHEPKDNVGAWKLRPEYIQAYHTVLPSNVHQGHAADDNAVTCASHYLQKSIVPACVHRLETHVTVVDSGAVTAMLHADGVNMRYLGRLYELATLKHVRRLLLTEMVARAAKVLLRAMVREGPGHWRAIVVDFFNVLCGSGNDSVEFYANEIEPTVALKYGVVVKDIRQELHMPQLCFALQVHTGVHMAPADHAALHFDFTAHHPFRATNVRALEPLVMLLCTTTAACRRVIDADVEDKDIALQNAKLALAVEQACPTDPRHIHLCSLLATAADLSLQVGDVADAETFATLALEEGPTSHAVLVRAYVVLMKLYDTKHDLQSVLHAYNKALDVATWHLGPSHPFVLEVLTAMVDIYVARKSWPEALTALEQSAAVVKEAFGRTAKSFAEIRCKQAVILHSVGSHDQALSMYEDALRVYEGMPSAMDSATCCTAMSNLLLEMKMLHPAYNTAMKAHELLKECSPDDHMAMLASWMQLGTCAKALDEDFRALECYKASLGLVKANQASIEDAVDWIQNLSRLLVPLILKTLWPEAKQYLDKIKRKERVQVDQDVLSFVVSQMYTLDAPAYMELIFKDLTRESNTPPGPLFQVLSSQTQLLGVLQLLDQ
ncbi:Aste57867_1484 [Aphanomyces stellatus]|uniref:Aste57867_1484 protein n=1 Tax=Aphanomyces stellatus TaxID=120398 RepID=A0A485KAR4_9STRA|nr:hypothetical protein As57867_001483 [Aphanomyces stellatus]VFT78700.1 Aste57867_1484 [Aphanomyces stellatus]